MSKLPDRMTIEDWIQGGCWPELDIFVDGKPVKKVIEYDIPDGYIVKYADTPPVDGNWQTEIVRGVVTVTERPRLSRKLLFHPESDCLWEGDERDLQHPDGCVEDVTDIPEYEQRFKEVKDGNKTKKEG